MHDGREDYPGRGSLVAAPACGLMQERSHAPQGIAGQKLVQQCCGDQSVHDGGRPKQGTMNRRKAYAHKQNGNACIK